MALPHFDPRLLKHYADYELYLKKAKREFESKWRSEFRDNASMKDFDVLRTLGTGSFGRVVLVRHKVNLDKIYAMKMMEKCHVVKTKQVDHTLSEIRIMDALEHEFLVKMCFFFKDNVYLYLTMPFINGGEMFTHLRSQRKFDETMCKFYGGQVILAFEYMHYLGLVYRDLKPENIMIDADGYIKITDYGFCKKIDDQRTWTLCGVYIFSFICIPSAGTPEYLAPEVIMSQGYNRSVDWWAIGILIYEMAAGYAPFYAKDPMRIYEKIVSGKFHCPQHFTRSLTNLLTNMIQVDRTKRYGGLKNGARDVKSHEWFRSLDWDALLQRRLKPSFKPTVGDIEDSSNFEEYDEEPIRQSDKDEYANEFAAIVVRR